MVKGSCEEHGPFLIPKIRRKEGTLMGAGRKDNDDLINKGR
jgi:hypothetical protein